MYAVSDAFKAAAVAGCQRMAVRVAVLVGGHEVDELAFESGGVSIDSRRSIVRSLSLAVAPGSNAWELLTVYGAELKAWRGFTLAGVDELVPLGVFVLDGDLEEGAKGVITLSAADRSHRIARNRWRAPYRIAAGTDVGAAVRALLEDRWADCPVGFDTIGETVASTSVLQAGADSDPWRDALKIMADHGLALYFDGDGVAQYRPVADPTETQPCATYHSGGPLSVVIDRKRRAAMGEVYNGVVARGEGTGLSVPVQAEVWDDDPSSPTYRGGPLGEVPYFYSSPLLTTTAQCEMAARTRLAKIRGRAESLEWTLVPNPAHEDSDVIEFVDEDQTSHRYMLDVITVPLTATEPMPATARETRVF